MKNRQIILLSIEELKKEVSIALSIVVDGEYRNDVEKLITSLDVVNLVKFYGWHLRK